MARSRLNVRRARVASLVLAVTLLSGSAIGLVLTEYSQRQAEILRDQELAAAATQRTDTLSAYFERTRAISLLNSRNPSFAAFYDEPGTRTAKLAAHAPSVIQAETALTYLGELYPGSIGEVGFIDRDGAENASVVDGHAVPLADLSQNEKANPFFFPAFAVPDGEAYLSEPHISPDTGQWVVSVATPLRDADGTNQALVHFELTVDSFRFVLGLDRGAGSAAIVDERTGAVIVSAERPQTIGKALGDGQVIHLPSGVSGWVDSGDDRLYFNTVPSSPWNANHWIVVTSTSSAVVAPAVPIAILVALGLIGVVLIAIAARGFSEAKRDLEQTRDAAVLASRFKSEFLANMSHEIRTPMNGVIGLTGLLIDSGLDERQRRYAEGVRGAGDALLAIINDILDFSKIEAGKLEIEVVDLDLAQVLEAAVGLIRPAAEHKGLSLVADFGPTLPAGLQGDPSRIRQVLLNLLANAVKFTESGEVVLRVRLVEELDHCALLQFEVVDTGIGIAADGREHLFEAFSQADASTTRRFGGSGLGLAISRQLVAAMGGALRVDSELGRGSTFSFGLTLPLTGSSAAAIAAATPAASVLEGSRVGGTRARILVVEDITANQIVAAGILEKLGYLSDVVANGSDALDAVASTEYAAVLMDCQMPYMDGYEATREIRRRELGTRRLPIIAMTAGAMDGDRVACLAAGMDDYISKPVRPEDVDAALSRWLVPGSWDLSPSPSAELMRPAGGGSPREVLDSGRLDKLRELGPVGGSLLSRVLAAFLADARVTLVDLNDAFSVGDGSAVSRAAHDLRGAAGNVGAAGLVNLCAEVEAVNAAGPMEDGSDLLDRLAIEMELVVTAVHAELGPTWTTAAASPANDLVPAGVRAMRRP